jgi:hypothetical protein
VSDLIIDASVAVKWFVSEEASDKADEVSASNHTLLAPRLIVIEVANALARKAMQKLITPLEAARRRDTQMLTADQKFIANIKGTNLAKIVVPLSEWRA